MNPATGNLTDAVIQVPFVILSPNIYILNINGRRQAPILGSGCTNCTNLRAPNSVISPAPSVFFCRERTKARYTNFWKWMHKNGTDFWRHVRIPNSIWGGGQETELLFWLVVFELARLKHFYKGFTIISRVAGKRMPIYLVMTWKMITRTILNLVSTLFLLLGRKFILFEPNFEQAFGFSMGKEKIE